jgi:hypothetical protein
MIGAVERSATTSRRSVIQLGVFAVVAFSDTDELTKDTRWVCVVRREGARDALYSSGGFRTEEGALLAGQRELARLRDDLLATFPTRAAEHEHAVLVRRAELGELPRHELVARAREAAIYAGLEVPDVPELIGALARHEVAQELTARWCEEDMASAEAE